jgi:hypothetical protein
MNKKVAFGTKPAPKAAPASIDELVKSRAEGAAANETKTGEGTRRVSVDLPMSLHTKLKLHCVQNGVLMADYLRDLITKHFESSKS